MSPCKLIRAKTAIWLYFKQESGHLARRMRGKYLQVIYRPRKRNGGDACGKQPARLNCSLKNGFALEKRLRKLYT
eukprot:SAG11_NODE_22766_length_400_cov_1.255814_1_plen_74_part_10